MNTKTTTLNTALEASAALLNTLRALAKEAWATYDAIAVVAVEAPSVYASDESWAAYYALQAPKAEAWTAYGDARQAILAACVLDDALEAIRAKAAAR